MADSPETPAVNAGEEVVSTPSSLPLKPEDQFRLINQRLDSLTDQLGRVAAPAQFRLADVIQLVAIFIGILVAIVGAFNLSERISEVRTDQGAMERRMTDNLSASENRVSPKLEKLTDLYTTMIERISRLEGAKASPNK